MKKLEVSSSIESLQSHLKLPILTKARWILRPIGMQSDFSIGPQDYELVVYSTEITSPMKEYIEKNLKLNDVNYQTAAIDSSVAKAFGIDIASFEKAAEICIIKGMVYDATPLLINMTSGVLILTDYGMFIIAGTS